MCKQTARADEYDQGFRGTEIIRTRKGKPIYARTQGQQALVDAIQANDIIFVNGPSGTGKTAIATWLGIAGIDAGVYERLVLTRPVVTSGEELGFLPGTMDEKVAPYMQPLYDAISLIKGGRDEKLTEPEQLPEMLSAKEKKRLRAVRKDEDARERKSFYDLVQVCPLAYIRGSTLANSFIVCDEFQNVTISQMKTMLTRLGRNSKMVICGDSQQCDLPSRVTSGFSHAMDLLKGVRRVGFVELDVEDIIRHRLIKDIILRYERPELQHLSSPDSPEDDARDYVNKTHFPGWHPDREGFDFSEDDLDDEPTQDEINEDNERFADEWRRRKTAT